MKKNDWSIIDYLDIGIKWKKPIIYNFLGMCILTAIISLIIPKWYKAETAILPPLSDGSLMGLSGIFNQLPMSGIGSTLDFGAVSGETSLFIAILNSRTIMEDVINKFNLMKKYKSKNMEEAVEQLRDNISIEINDNGTITFSVLAKTSYFTLGKKDNEIKKLVRDMTNFFIKRLDFAIKRLKIESAMNTRIFIEKRYNENIADLKNAEERFRDYQEKYGTIALPEQTTATIGVAAEIKGQIISKEVEVGVLEKYFSNSHFELKRAKIELLELKLKYNDFNKRSNNQALTNIHDSPNDLFLPLDEIPGLALDYVRLYREVTIQEKILEFLLPQYEQAKIQEAKNTPTVQVIDPAVLPEEKAKPKRALIVILAGLFSLVLSSAAIYSEAHINYMKVNNPDRFLKLQHLINELKPRQPFK